MKYLFLLFITVCLITIVGQAQTVRKMKMYEFETLGAAQEGQRIISDALLGSSRTTNAVDYQQWDGQILDANNLPRFTGTGTGRMYYIWVDETPGLEAMKDNTDLKAVIGITTVNGSIIHDWQRIDPEY